METKVQTLALVLGMLTLANSCASGSTSNTQSQQSPSAIEVSNSVKTAFDYFTEAIVGKPRVSRNDYTASEDDDELVDGVAKDPNTLGYFGYAYYEKHQDKLKALSVDNGRGAIAPSRQTVEKAQYQPLSRPLLIYVNPQTLSNRGTLHKFVDFYIKNAPKTVSSVGYIPLPDEAYQLDYVHFYRDKVGTVFDGKAEINLTIGELLRKEAKF